MNVPSTQQLFEAITFAAERHRGQRRKDVDATPYINHPIAVAAALVADGITDGPLIIAALLHDTVEDTKTSSEQLEKHFGPDVRGLVEEVSDNKALPKDVRKRLQIEHAPSLSHRAKQLKLADLSCNVLDVALRPPTDWSLDRRLGYLDWAERVAAGCRGISPRLEARFHEALLSSRQLLESAFA